MIELSTKDAADSRRVSAASIASLNVRRSESFWRMASRADVSITISPRGFEVPITAGRQPSGLHWVEPLADATALHRLVTTVASGGTEMIACYRTLADSGALIIWGCLQGREITQGCRSVSLTRQRPGEQPVVLFFYYRITLTTAFFQRCAIEHHDVPACVTDQPGML